MKYALNKPSEMFIDSLPGGGSHYMYCNCGREHFCPDAEIVVDGGEDYEFYLSDALAAKEKHPDRVEIHYGVDFVAGKSIDDRTYVEECPCNGLTKYEEFIWKHHTEISKYINARVAQEKQWKEEEEVVRRLLGAGKKYDVKV